MFAYLRKSTSVKALSLLAVGTSLMMSCSKDQVQPSAPIEHHSASAAAYSGEELFQGIFLMQGDVATHIPSFQATRTALANNDKQRPAQLQKRQAMTARLLAAVRSLDPGYFAELRQAVVSRNFSQIEQSLRKGAALQHTALQQVVSATRLAKQQQQRSEALKQIDFAKYDFAKQADFEQFLHDSKAIGGGTGTESSVAAEDELLIIDNGGVVITYALLWYFDMYPWIILGNEQEGISAQVSTVMQKRADLEKEKLVRDIAFLQ
ncbi:hypothetical protein [Hymenobacter cellulosilyticus]|uniref:DUF4142 domain-containing protein n=1 Tax=Hymenobacter cellulosilyticus TaxID=2932248 RepID=A0A8T9QIN8_9BACT|nr:hypothetical protein [Hymenobacter cellulosilyticus]UOQ74653.1 hypothetical protein MUN79_12740 [Hymenobacter cellulosilyticus]